MDQCILIRYKSLLCQVILKKLLWTFKVYLTTLMKTHPCKHNLPIVCNIRFLCKVQQSVTMIQKFDSILYNQKTHSNTRKAENKKNSIVPKAFLLAVNINMQITLSLNIPC